jgi:hypothetical protein
VLAALEQAGDVVAEGLFARHPALRLAARRDALAWARGDGLVLRGLTALPDILGPAARG